MAHQRQIDAALDGFSAVICSNVGRGKPLGAQEVADDTGVTSAETIHNYCRGSTVPTVEWLVRLIAVYGERFPAVVDPALDALFSPMGRRVVRVDGGERSFLDANSDGRLDAADVRLHENKAAEYAARRQRLSDSGGTAAELAELLAQQQRELDAAEACRRAVRQRSG